MNEIKLEQKKPVRIHLSKKKKLIIGGTILAIALLIGGLLWWWSLGDEETVQQANPVASNTSCNQTIITKAAPLIRNQQGVELSQLTHEIMKIPGFDRDVNCLYIVIYSYINLSNGAEARKYYNKLAPIYNPNEGFSQYFGPQVSSPEGLKKQIEFIEKAQSRPAIVDEGEN